MNIDGKNLIGTEQEFFTCKECGNHALTIERAFTLNFTFTYTLKCTCGKQKNKIAAKKQRGTAEGRTEQGYFHKDHTWRRFNAETQWVEDDEGYYGLEIYCEHCAKKATWQDWQVSNVEVADNEGDIEILLNCKECGREIEFGFCEKGYIWPAECSDFDPTKCTPYYGYWS